MARHKVLDINADGVNLYCTFDDTEKTSNPYRLYRRWYEYRGDRDYGCGDEGRDHQGENLLHIL